MTHRNMGIRVKSYDARESTMADFERLYTYME